MRLFKRIKEVFDDKCRETAVVWPGLIAEKGSQIVYWMAALFTISSVIDAEDFQEKWEQFKQLMSGLGTESLGDLIQNLRNKKTDDERARLLQATAENSTEVKKAFDSLLEKIDGIQILLQTFNEQHTDPNKREWFHTILEQTLSENKSCLRIKIDGSAVAIGKKSSATSGDYSPSLGSGKQEIHYHFQTPPIQCKSKSPTIVKLTASERGYESTLRVKVEKLTIENVWFTPKGNFVCHANPSDVVESGKETKFIFTTNDPNKRLENILKFEIHYLDEDGNEGALKYNYYPYAGKLEKQFS